MNPLVRKSLVGLATSGLLLVVLYFVLAFYPSENSRMFVSPSLFRQPAWIALIATEALFFTSACTASRAYALSARALRAFRQTLISLVSFVLLWGSLRAASSLHLGSDFVLILACTPPSLHEALWLGRSVSFRQHSIHAVCVFLLSAATYLSTILLGLGIAYVGD